MRKLLLIPLLLLWACPKDAHAQTFVQKITQGCFSGTTTTGPCAFGSNTTAGNTIIVEVTCNVNPCGSMSVTDSHNSYTNIVTFTDATENYVIGYFEADNVTGAADSVTANVNTGAAVGGWVAEYSGLAVSAYDKGASARGTAASASSGNTATTSFAKELVLGTIVNGGGSAISSGAGFTQRENTANVFRIVGEDKDVTSTGVQAATGTADGTHAWFATVVTFKASSQPSSAVFRHKGGKWR